MLALTLNGLLIPIPQDISMRLTWKSPICDFEKIPSSYGLGISLPINEYTRSIFGNPERFTKYRSGNDQKFPGFEARFGGVLLMSGTLAINNSTKENYEATLIDQVGVLSEKEQERNILEIPKFSENIPWINSANYNSDDHHYCCFPFKNIGFFKDKGIVVKRTEDIPDPLNPSKTTAQKYDVEILSVCFFSTTGYKVNALSANGQIRMEGSSVDLSIVTQKNNTYEDGKVTVVSPFFFLNRIIIDTLKDTGYHINKTSNFLDTDENIKNACIYNNYDITKTTFSKKTENYTYKDNYKQSLNYAPASRNGDIYKDIDSEDLYREGSIVVGMDIWKYNRSYESEIKPVNHLPKISTGELILSTQNLFNVCLHFLPNKTINIYSREDILKGNAIDLDKFFVGSWSIGEKKNVTLKFIWEHDDKDLVFAERFNDLSDRISDLKQPLDSWGDLLFIQSPTEGEIHFLKQEKIFVEYKWISIDKVDKDTYSTNPSDVLGWEEISIGFQNGWFKYGREEIEEIKTTWSTCAGKYMDIIVGNRGATVDQAGNMDAWKASKQAFSPRLLLYRGANSGANENSEFALDWEKEDKGILAKYWKLWNPFWSNRLPITGEFDLPINILRHLVYNICNKFRTREGEFLIEEMSCELFIDRIGTTQINGFKV